MKLILMIPICFLAIGAGCQSYEKTFWHFGETSRGLYFDVAGNSPVVTNNSYTPYTNEGCAVLNHPISGDLLFYSDGIKAVDTNHDVMPNGANLFGHISCFGSGKIAVDPLNCNRFYLFYSNAAIEVNPNGTAYYSIIDMNLPGNGTLANPLGDIVAGQKNIQITTNTAEGIELVPETNSRNYWLLLTHNSGSSIDVFHLTSTGLSFTANYNLIASLTDMRGFKISPLHNKGAVLSLRENEEAIIFDFNAISGAISGQQIIPGTPMGSNSGWYGLFDVEWSSDGTKVYLSKYRDIVPAGGGKLLQYDLNTPGNAPALIYQISNSNSNLGRGLRRGPDEKIYWIYHNPTTNNTQYIAAVNDPNLPAVSCDFEPVSIDMGVSIGGVHCFPTFLEFNNTVPEPIQNELTLTTICGLQSLDTLFYLSQFVQDNEDDNLIITSASAAFGSVLVNTDSFAYSSPEGITSDTIHIEYCDDYCYSLCSEMDFIIDFNNTNVNELITNDVISCFGSFATIETEYAGFDYVWNNGETTPTITIDSAGEYVCTATSASGCVLSDTVLVTFQNIFLDLITDEELFLCDVLQAAVSINQADYSVIWSTGESTNTIIVTESDVYSIIATDNLGCLYADTIVISLNFSPQISITPDQDQAILCDGEFLLASVELSGSTTYNWSTGDANVPINLQSDGQYSVTTSNECGEASDNISTTALNSPITQLPEDFVQCFAVDTAITATITADNFVWNTGEITSSIQITNPGIYWIESVNYCGLVRDSITVVLISPERAVLDFDNLICIGDETWLVADSMLNTSYEWSTGENVQQIDVTQGGSFNLTATNSCGSWLSTLEVPAFYCTQAIYVPNTFTPDDDGINDVWRVFALNEAGLVIKIFNRWGEKIFESLPGVTWWTGNVQNGEYFAPNGIYVYEVSYLDFDGYPKSVRGHISLIR